jgi:LysM repeat protein
MSTLEKLLVLGVLILVGVILAISLFWNRPDAGGGLDGRPDSASASVVNETRNLDGGAQGGDAASNGLPNQSSLTAGAPTPRGGDLGTSLSIVQPADAANLAPYPFLQPSLSPEYWAYRVRQGDTPMIVSERVSGSRDFARAISRSNEDRPMVPGTTVLIPREIVKAPSSIETGLTADALTAGGSQDPKAPVGPIATGPPAAPKSATGELSEPKAAGTGTTPAAPPAAGTKEYVVKRGDSLRKIAREQLKSEKRWKEIKATNNLKSDAIREGQKLLLP